MRAVGHEKCLLCEENYLCVCANDGELEQCEIVETE